ncbi:hypothetical protein CRE_03977 [Caenorhabditis remanei]|uniref:Transmembrane protein 188 n=1 Tax=Caenorhabditis remanei TaxID=31234 RepID=E3LY56_CAERE|nr:hypothetical protein CRE_03977 [Caenorhabditis remanei]
MAARKLNEDPSAACEDLRFFERRLTEVITYMGPSCTRWRITIVVFAVIIGVIGSKYVTREVVGFFGYLADFTFVFQNIEQFETSISHFLFTTHLDFTICVCVGFLLFGLLGVHRRIVAPTIVARRCRDALAPFSLSCDHNGKLIVKPAVRSPTL